MAKALKGASTSDYHGVILTLDLWNDGQRFSGLPFKFGLSVEYLGGKLVNLQATYVSIDVDRQTNGEKRDSSPWWEA